MSSFALLLILSLSASSLNQCAGFAPHHATSSTLTSSSSNNNDVAHTHHHHHHHHQQRQQPHRSGTNTQLYSEAAPSQKRRPASPEEIRKRANALSGIPEESEEALRLFEDSLYDDMQQFLLTLERRVKEGPAELTLMDVEELEAQGQRILHEMKEFEGKRLNGEVESPKARVVIPQEGSTIAVDANTAFESAEDVPAMATPLDDNGDEVMDTSNDEGPKYDGTGGMGLARGTTNTYVIPGMDEMSPDEYKKALQDSIINHQKYRHATGTYGNKATWDYLNSLTGESGVLKDGA